MARYDLDSPYSKGAKLRPLNPPGMIPRYYYCPATATVCALLWTAQGRTLHKVNTSTGDISGEKSADVPNDWDGEPWKVRVALSDWRSGQIPTLAFRMTLENGDTFVVFDDADPNERVVGEIVLDANNEPSLKDAASA